MSISKAAAFFLLASQSYAHSHKHVPEEALEEYRKTHGITFGYPLATRYVDEAANTIDMPSGDRVNLDNLIRVQNLFSTTADCWYEGVRSECPFKTNIFTKKDENGRTVEVYKNTNGEITTVTLRSNIQGEKRVQQLEAVDAESGAFTYIPDDEAAVDPEYWNKFETRSKDLSNRFLRRTNQLEEMPDEEEVRKLQQNNCNGKFREIEVAIAADSSFCIDEGSNEASAMAEIEKIMVNVKAEYEMKGLCFTVVITHVEIYCNPSDDPYKAGVDLNLSGCGNDGLLDFFQDFWDQNRQSVNRDVAELFSGTGLECGDRGCVIGCAYLARTCRGSGAYGVNYVTYTSSPIGRSNLVAHEMGHTLGASHFSGDEFIMNDFNRGNDRFFSENSINSFLATRNTGSDGCITPPVNPEPECYENQDCEDGDQCNGVNECNNGMCVQVQALVDCGSCSFCNPTNGQCTPGEEFTVSVTTDGYPDETTWQFEHEGDVVARGGPYNARSSTFESDVCIEPKPGNGRKFTFTLFDSYGDGLCCSEGPGSYEVTYEGGGTVVANGAEFRRFESKEFDLDNLEDVEYSIVIQTDSDPGEITAEVWRWNGSSYESKDLLQPTDDQANLLVAKVIVMLEPGLAHYLCVYDSNRNGISDGGYAGVIKKEGNGPPNNLVTIGGNQYNSWACAEFVS